ncbi:MAG: N-acyl homoserine lactonase family protein [Solirubrobacterales bacterium]
MKVHIEPKPLDAPLPRGRGDATVEVEPIVVGEVTQPGAYFQRTGGPFESLRAMGLGTPRSRWWTVPCTAFLVRHPSAGPFLVDTGLHGSVAAKPSENMGRIFSWYAKPDLEGGRDLPSQLRQRGVEAADIRLVVMTHLHLDHASGMADFPGATFVLSTAEWEDATSGGRPLLRGYLTHQYDYAFDFRTVSFAREIESYSTFGRTFDLFGDGSVRLAYTPGHSAGHQSVICRLADRDLVIAGDVVYTLAQLETAPGQARPFDPHTYNRSLQELRLFAQQYPHAVIIPSHDPELWKTLEPVYR